MLYYDAEIKCDGLMRDMPWTVYFKCCERLPTHHFREETAITRLERHRTECPNREGFVPAEAVPLRHKATSTVVEQDSKGWGPTEKGTIP